jgi:hypothetical protein
MGMRPSDNDIDHEIRDAEKYADAAIRALSLESVTRWNKLMQRGAARHRPWWPTVGVRSPPDSISSMPSAPAAGS